LLYFVSFLPLPHLIEDVSSLSYYIGVCSRLSIFLVISVLSPIRGKLRRRAINTRSEGVSVITVLYAEKSKKIQSPSAFADSCRREGQSCSSGAEGELVRLAVSCGFIVLAHLVLKHRGASARGGRFASRAGVQGAEPQNFLPGKGKLAELAEFVQTTGCACLVFGHDLSPSQKKTFEDAVACPVISRTELILELFARQARSSIAKQQVELARLEYHLSRLEGGYTHLASSQGGSGFRGPGETQIELDRRRIRKRIGTLKDRLRLIGTSKEEQRKKRLNRVPLVALCGYTNAGKTSLMNRLARTSLLAEDRLFATLDTTVRSVYSPQGGKILLADTVGFIRGLPHSLIEAFKSTLEEIRFAALIVIVFDAGDDDCDEQIAVVEKVLDEIGATKQARIYCANKCDVLPDVYSGMAREPLSKVSAHTGMGIDELLIMIEKAIMGCQKENS
jgi:GTP-binding protein HflX